MAYYILQCFDREGTVEKRLAIRPAHVARLEQLNAEGRLLVAGAIPKERDDPQAGFFGSCIIADFDSLEAAEAWVSDEPFLKEGIYSHIDIKPFNKAFPLS